jgi:hypothetical protein
MEDVGLKPEIAFPNTTVAKVMTTYTFINVIALGRKSLNRKLSQPNQHWLIILYRYRPNVITYLFVFSEVAVGLAIGEY